MRNGIGTLRIIDFVGLDPDDNLLIQGEARQTLATIADHPRYAGRVVGQVRVAYLDPPYNTGQNFTHYRDKIDTFNWNTRMKATLQLVHRFLADDGSVWLQLNDSEQHRARLVLDEVFGPHNFVTTIIWVRTQMPRLGQKAFAIRHDYIHVYRKSKAFRLAMPSDIPAETIWSDDRTGSNELASIESRELFGTPFTTPKPEQLIKRILELTTEPGDLVLDCFAGSGTTPAVAHKLGRRWIAVELEASTVDGFIRPRLERVVDGSDQSGISREVGWSGGGGFTHLAVDG